MEVEMEQLIQNANPHALLNKIWTEITWYFKIKSDKHAHKPTL